MAQTQPGSSPAFGGDFPRVPAFAWSWLQRSRPVVLEAAQRLTGQLPEPGFVDHLREQFDSDAFTRDVVVSVIADVAFHGRVPRRRPPGASWDRGLIWWAATIAGMTVEDFEGRHPSGVQPQLFVDQARPVAPRPRSTHSAPRNARTATTDRALLAALLRDVLATAENGRVSVTALEHLVAQLEGHSADPGSRQ